MFHILKHRCRTIFAASPRLDASQIGWVNKFKIGTVWMFHILKHRCRKILAASPHFDASQIV